MRGEEGMESRRRKRRVTDRLDESKQQEEDETRDWSALTDPLLYSILQRLDTLEDFFAFHGACRSWRSLSAPTPDSMHSQSPLILLTRFPSRAQAFYDITRRRLYNTQLPWNLSPRFTVGYSHGFLITSTPAPNQKPLLWNLFTELVIRLPKAPKPFRHAILSSTPLSRECSILLFQRGMTTIQYAGIGDHLWRVHHLGNPSKPKYIINDMIFFGGRFYSLSTDGLLSAVDLVSHPKLAPLEAENPESGHGEASSCEWRLAESDGELLLVCFRFEIRSHWRLPIPVWGIPEGDWLRRVDVYRWDFARGERVMVTGLGGKALFMGYEGFAASIAPNGLGVRGNCIYCIGCLRNEWFVFSMEDQTVEIVSPTSPGLAIGQIWEPPTWVFPSIC